MVWLIVATLAASFIKGVCGFANTLVFTTILSFSFNNIQITAEIPAPRSLAILHRFTALLGGSPNRSQSSSIRSS